MLTSPSPSSPSCCGAPGNCGYVLCPHIPKRDGGSGPDPASPSEPEIKDGIEWYEHEGQSYASCARCGSTAEFRDCWNCGGDGWIESDDWQDFGEDQPCRECRRVGGSWHCISSPEWCEAHPIAGREHIQSTALRSEAWND